MRQKFGKDIGKTFKCGESDTGGSESPCIASPNQSRKKGKGSKEIKYSRQSIENWIFGNGKNQ